MKFFIVLVPLLLLACSTPNKTLSARKQLTPREQIIQFQKELNAHYSNPKKSPLRKKAKDFTAHSFYPIDLEYRVEAKLQRLENEAFFKLKTSGQKTPEYRKYGILHFELKGKTYELTLLQSKSSMQNPMYKDYLFLAFHDLTNGNTTYGGGRYIDMRIPEGDTMILDFNQSYHPYCAYTDGYNCPIPPAENRMDTAIEAGIILNEAYRH